MTWLLISFLFGGPIGLLAVALGLLMAAQRAKAWWTSRGEVDELPADDPPTEAMSTEEQWEAIETSLEDSMVVDRRFKALMKAQKLPLYRRIPGLRPRLGAGRRTP